MSSPLPCVEATTARLTVVAMKPHGEGTPELGAVFEAKFMLPCNKYSHRTSRIAQLSRRPTEVNSPEPGNTRFSKDYLTAKQQKVVCGPVKALRPGVMEST